VENGILKFLFEHPDLLVKILVELDSVNLKFVLERKENGILAFLLKHPDQLVKVLVKLDSLNLEFVLELEVGGKKVYEHIKNMLIDSNISDSIKSKLTEILQKSGLNRFFPKITLVKERNFGKIILL
jgi:hypothetical protein